MKIFTIGCSTLFTEAFVANLKLNSIDAIADVRSVPYSRFTPRFNKEALQKTLSNAEIFYIPMSEEFGARRAEEEAYTDNKVDFEKTSQLPLFKEGIKRIDLGLKKGLRIALMCAEKDPLDCHRFVLVGRALDRELGVEVFHIHSDGSLEDKASIERRLLERMKIPPGAFEDEKSVVEKAYRVLEGKMGWKKE